MRWTRNGATGFLTLRWREASDRWGQIWPHPTTRHPPPALAADGLGARHTPATATSSSVTLSGEANRATCLIDTGVRPFASVAPDGGCDALASS
jgi:hypothetical protein